MQVLVTLYFSNWPGKWLNSTFYWKNRVSHQTVGLFQTPACDQHIARPQPSHNLFQSPIPVFLPCILSIFLTNSLSNHLSFSPHSNYKNRINMWSLFFLLFTVVFFLFFFFLMYLLPFLLPFGFSHPPYPNLSAE